MVDATAERETGTKPDTFEEWMDQQFEEQELRDMVTHGVAGGFSGLIYYSETTDLFEAYANEIWKRVVDEAEALGYEPLEFVAQLNSNAHTWDQFRNLLVWFAAEDYARRKVDV